jgi:hypothetical protein
MMAYVLSHEPYDLDRPDDGGMIVGRTLGGDYIGDERKTRWLCDELGIVPELISPEHRVCSVGFCEREQKWYGWSHRAIYGFGIGSQVKKGDCGYVADTPEGLIESRADFFGDIPGGREKAIAECAILPDRSGIRIIHHPLLVPLATSAADIVDAVDGSADLPMIDLYGGSNALSIEKCGRGEWTAATLADARQMACDFAESVS